jgi:hypothetical protein
VPPPSAGSCAQGSTFGEVETRVHGLQPPTVRCAERSLAASGQRSHRRTHCVEGGVPSAVVSSTGHARMSRQR